MKTIQAYFGENKICPDCGLQLISGTTHYCGLGNRGAGGAPIPDSYWTTIFPKYYPEFYAYQNKIQTKTEGSGNYPIDKLEDVLERIHTRLQAIQKELK